LRAEELRDLPQAELRTLLDSLDLMITYHRRQRAADVELTLTGSAGRGGVAQVCSVAGTGFESL